MNKMGIDQGIDHTHAPTRSLFRITKKEMVCIPFTISFELNFWFIRKFSGEIVVCLLPHVQTNEALLVRYNGTRIGQIMLREKNEIVIKKILDA